VKTIMHLILNVIGSVRPSSELRPTLATLVAIYYNFVCLRMRELGIWNNVVCYFNLFNTNILTNKFIGFRIY